MLLLWFPLLNAMHASPGTPESPKKPTSPREIATCLSLRLFDKPDDQVIAVFSQILTRDVKGNVALMEIRYRMIGILKETVCAESR